MRGSAHECRRGAVDADREPARDLAHRVRNALRTIEERVAAARSNAPLKCIAKRRSTPRYSQMGDPMKRECLRRRSPRCSCPHRASQVRDNLLAARIRHNEVGVAVRACGECRRSALPGDGVLIGECFEQKNDNKNGVVSTWNRPPNQWVVIDDAGSDAYIDAIFPVVSEVLSLAARGLFPVRPLKYREESTMSNEQVAPETKGVTVKLLATVDLGRDRGHGRGRLRMRMVTIEPGGSSARFTTINRPGTVYILQGTITDHPNVVATDYGPGVGWPEDRNTTHWLENRGGFRRWRSRSI